jgi:molybdopterin/thiamine biosynthesis adenylyltransferase/proteasome lid subunit RPN8/RPN11
MYRFVGFVDSSLHDIERDIASHPPERGGALLGPIGQPVVSKFLYDTRANTSGATYKPSSMLQSAVTEAESHDENIELKGMLHSHPGAMNHPSGGDRIAYADSLRGAPWLGRFICPIVTVGRQAREDHEIQTPSGVVSVFVASLAHAVGIELQPATVHVIPIGRDVASLASALGGEPLAIGTVELGGAIYLTSGVESDDLELQLLFPATYPNEPPLVLTNAVRSDRSRRGGSRHRWSSPGQPGETTQLPIVWSFEISDADRLKEAILPHLRISSKEGTRSSRTGFVRSSGTQVSEVARDGIRERLAEVVSPQISRRHVLVAGAGSGGSQTADALARSGVERFTLIDSDMVSPVNLSRSVYRMSDVDRPKVEALADHLAAINPRVECTLFESRLQEVAPTEFDKAIRHADLVIGATDDPGAQRTLNHFSYARGIPALFAGMYARGMAGEVIFTVPGITKCYRCTTASRHSDGDDHVRSVDYGTGRLSGEPALGVDISYVVSASVKIALGLLQLEEDDVTNSSAQMMIDALSAGYNYVILSTVPRWDFFGEIFKNTAGQHAYQSAWLGARGDPLCPICGEQPIDPLGVPSRAPRVDTLVVADPKEQSR